MTIKGLSSVTVENVLDDVDRGLTRNTKERTDTC